ncbi:hypothetical protein AB685_14655 [Bacillus sp. LL01]|uniref:GNAT family N-acetyltransferase n=1 Tax=Bacillus sp. LL01 TaxID=1665556 RepID=UPI00064D71BE|nr:GNAT family N-acetyltransferase [Bacillus sp. LL01]KMJ58052.1 hypothetical protein AB685_14655 [Bacillus sp. LL01]
MTLKIVNATARDTIDSTAEFISMLNGNAETHIGYCGKKKEEIASTLRDEFTDVPYEKSFVLAYEGDTLAGSIGFDADLEQRSAEVWGPFVARDDLDLESLLFQQMLKLIPSKVDKLYLFPNKKNVLAKKLASTNEFILKSEQTILNMDRTGGNYAKHPILEEISPKQYKEMIDLHNRTFPKTYYDGEQIIQRMTEHRKVFVVKKEDHLAGYIYVEVEPEFSEASIEFFAVDERFQGEGIGTELLKCAVAWIFSFKQMDSLQLCVNTTNSNAIRLYQKAGFQLDAELDHYEKNLKLSAAKV